MNDIRTLLACALISTTFASLAHEGEDHKKTGPFKKEQMEWGIAGDAKAVKRTIELTMSDNMRFTPDRIEVKQGEVVKIVVKNNGTMFHEMVFGTKAKLEEHAALMVKFPNMEHDEPYMAHVKPGTTNAIIWNFNRPGDFDFACLVAGHYQAGMVGKIAVLAPGKSSSTSPAQATSSAAATPVASTTQPSSASQEMSEGEVRKVDRENKKITLKHGEIKNLDMPPMTMVFQVSDPALLDKVQPGDKIRFKASNEGGKLTINEIQ